MGLHRYALVGSAAALALSGIGCGSGTLRAHNEAIASFNSFLSSESAAQKAVDLYDRKGWHEYIRLQRQRDGALAQTWKRAPAYVHRFFRSAYRSQQRQSIAFINAANQAVRLSQTPITNYTAFQSATRSFHDADKQASRAWKDRVSADKEAQKQADKWADTLRGKSNIPKE